jgi:hypothetical protein
VVATHQPEFALEPLVLRILIFLLPRLIRFVNPNFWIQVPKTSHVARHGLLLINREFVFLKLRFDLCQQYSALVMTLCVNLSAMFSHYLSKQAISRNNGHLVIKIGLFGL